MVSEPGFETDCSVAVMALAVLSFDAVSCGGGVWFLGPNRKNAPAPKASTRTNAPMKIPAFEDVFAAVCVGCGRWMPVAESDAGSIATVFSAWNFEAASIAALAAFASSASVGAALSGATSTSDEDIDDTLAARRTPDCDP